MIRQSRSDGSESADGGVGSAPDRVFFTPRTVAVLKELKKFAAMSEIIVEDDGGDVGRRWRNVVDGGSRGGHRDRSWSKMNDVETKNRRTRRSEDQLLPHLTFSRFH